MRLARMERLKKEKRAKVFAIALKLPRPTVKIVYIMRSEWPSVRSTRPSNASFFQSDVSKRFATLSGRIAIFIVLKVTRVFLFNNVCLCGCERGPQRRRLRQADRAGGDADARPGGDVDLRGRSVTEALVRRPSPLPSWQKQI